MSCDSCGGNGGGFADVSFAFGSCLRRRLRLPVDETLTLLSLSGSTKFRCGDKRLRNKCPPTDGRFPRCVVSSDKDRCKGKGNPFVVLLVFNDSVFGPLESFLNFFFFLLDYFYGGYYWLILKYANIAISLAIHNC
jgi:hypothetical protein